MKKCNNKKYLAELIGTLALVFFGCGTAVIAGNEVGYLGISFAFGLTLLSLIYAIGPISGCHVNPAVTIAMLIAGKINKSDTIWYIVAQCIGAAAGAALIGIIAGDITELAGKYGQNGFGNGSPKGYGLEAAFLMEFVLTFLFLFVIFAATCEKNNNGAFAGIAIGIALVFVHLIGIPVTGTSVNPARSFGPAIFAGGEAFGQLWLFVVAPIAGAVSAAAVWRCIFGCTNKED